MIPKATHSRGFQRHSAQKYMIFFSEEKVALSPWTKEATPAVSFELALLLFFEGFRWRKFPLSLTEAQLKVLTFVPLLPFLSSVLRGSRRERTILFGDYRGR